MILLCLVVLAAMPGPAIAADPARTIMLGESNTAAQREELLDYFEAGDDDQILDVTLADTRRAMEGIFDVSDITSAYSSTALTCRAAGTGVKVKTRNIQVVPPALYAMALATAGIDDATLVVAAPDDAPAEGMTALTGVFQTWDVAPCGGATLDETRRQLALEQLSLTVRIGRALGDDGGVQSATELLLATQQVVVVDRPRDRAAVERAVGAQERATGIRAPDELRGDLVDLMARLSSERIDWGSLDGGWSLAQAEDDSGVTLRALAADDPEQAADAAPTATAPAESTATATAGAAAAPAAAARPAPHNSSAPLGALWLLGLLGLVGLLGGLLLVALRRRRRDVVVGFSPRTSPAIVSAVRLRVAGHSAETRERSLSAIRRRVGQPDTGGD